MNKLSEDSLIKAKELLDEDKEEEFEEADDLDNIERAEKELGVEVKYLESKQDADYTTNIETLVDEEVDLILGVGAKLAPTIEEAAKNYPEQKFLMVDETYEEIPSNVKSVLFDAEQSAYLVGLIAGKMSETKNVGFIGGLDIPVINTFKYGYMAGVKTADANCEIQAQYANSFTDQAKYNGSATEISISESITYKGVVYSVTSLGGSCFFGCYSLASINIPSSVTSLGEYCFYG